MQIHVRRSHLVGRRSKIGRPRSLNEWRPLQVWTSWFVWSSTAGCAPLSLYSDNKCACKFVNSVTSRARPRPTQTTYEGNGTGNQFHSTLRLRVSRHEQCDFANLRVNIMIASLAVMHATQRACHTLSCTRSCGDWTALSYEMVDSKLSAHTSSNLCIASSQ